MPFVLLHPYNIQEYLYLHNNRRMKINHAAIVYEVAISR